MEAKATGGAVHVVGLGIRTISHLTLEANHVLQSVGKIFHGEYDPAVSDYIASLGGAEVKLNHLYEDGRLRVDAYQDICSAVIGSASQGETCAYLAPGNPVLLNSIVFRIREVATKQSIPLFVYAGVSCIDTFMLDLFLPLELTGMQCYESTHFVHLKPSIDVRVPLILFQPGVVEAYEVRHSTGSYVPGVETLQACLLSYYPQDTRWLLVRSPMRAGEQATIVGGKLSELAARASYMELGTLVIPGEWNVEQVVANQNDQGTP